MRRAAAFSALLLLAACGAESAPEPDAGPSVLALTLTGRMDATPDDDAVCLLNMDGENRLGRDAVNVQIAYTARTGSHGTVSEYIRIGDFAVGETRSGRMFVSAPCDDIQTVKLTRAVCTVSPVADPPESCADDVTLDGGGVIATAG